MVRKNSVQAREGRPVTFRKVRSWAIVVLGNPEIADKIGLPQIPIFSILNCKHEPTEFSAVWAYTPAVIGMPVEDYFQQGKRWWFRFHEKGGRLHEVPAHHKAEAHVDAWIDAAGIGEERKLPLFRTFGRNGEVTARPLYEADVLRMVKVRGKVIGLPESTCCHTFRATGITAYLENGGTIEKAQAIAAHASPRTTKLYDRTSDVLTLEEIEKIGI